MNYLYKAANEINKSVNKVNLSFNEMTKEVALSLTVKKDKYKKFMEMVIDYGYPIEKHCYTTEDGYINTVFRISGPRGTTAINNSQCDESKPVVIYQHGLFDSSAGICCDGIDSLAFLLADAGCDLWLNNSRGNRFSRNHKYYDPDVHEQYWNFSFMEMAKFD